jgi:hypothetical protein
MTKRIAILLVLTIIAGIFLLGCYTVLTHPRVEGEEEEHYSGRYYRENCTDCHVDYHQYPYGYYYGYSPDYYWGYPRWGYYYNYPWWWEWYWWDYYDDEGEYVPRDIEKGERRRSNLAPPYSGVTGTSAPAMTNPGDKGAIQVIKKILKGGSGKGTVVEQGSKKEEKKEEKKTEEKAPRRR